MGGGPPDSSVHEIFQVKILELVAISFSRRSSQPRDLTHVSCIGRWILYKKCNSKFIVVINVRVKILKLSEENRSNFYDLELGNGFLDMAPKAEATKIKKLIN